MTVMVPGDSNAYTQGVALTTTYVVSFIEEITRFKVCLLPPCINSYTLTFLKVMVDVYARSGSLIPTPLIGKGLRNAYPQGVAVTTTYAVSFITEYRR